MKFRTVNFSEIIIKGKKAFTLIELIIVVIIIGILMSIVYFVPKINDLSAIEGLFVTNFASSIMKNKIEKNDGYYFDISYKYCPDGDPNNCEWEETDNGKCIIGNYDFSQIPGNNSNNNLKKLIKNITKYKICPKYLPDGTENEEFAIPDLHKNPSLYLEYKWDGETRRIVFPQY